MAIRLLNANEIEVRVQSTKKTTKGVGCILLLYKDARCDMKMLDELYGITGWQRTHEVINGNLFCNIDIWDKEKGCWIRKQDVGVESNTEKEKGQASDSFKRAASCLGIGRELYTSPFIWVTLEQGEYYGEGEKVKVSPMLKFSVKTIGYNDVREINSLVVVDNKGKVRYSMGHSKEDVPQPKPTPKQEPKQEQKPLPKQEQTTGKITAAQRARMFAVAGKGNEPKVREIMFRHNYASSNDILQKDYEKIINEIMDATEEK